MGSKLQPFYCEMILVVVFHLNIFSEQPAL
jgi:hypothetical protein